MVLMLLYDEAPVYRLLPSGSEKIAPIAAVSTGLWYENYREFAIAPKDLGALDKLIRRETDRLTGNLPQLHKNEEREMNRELKSQGYLTVAGKCPAQYFKQKFYG